ncbi:MAG: hypothetical protein WD176_06530 [Pirellulales bacterium]
MANRHLRVYYGPSETSTATPAASRDGVASAAPGRENVTVRLDEILPLLADAVRSERTWLADFEGDSVTISTDLYEVILAYQHFRRPSA